MKGDIEHLFNAEILEKLEVEFEGMEANELIQLSDPGDNQTRTARQSRANAFGECRAITVDMRKEEEYAWANGEPQT